MKYIASLNLREEHKSKQFPFLKRIKFANVDYDFLPEQISDYTK